MISSERVAQLRSGIVALANGGGVMGAPFAKALIEVLDEYEATKVRPAVSQEPETSDKRGGNSHRKRK